MLGLSLTSTFHSNWSLCKLLKSSYLCEYKMQCDFPCAFFQVKLNNKIYSYIHRAWSKKYCSGETGWCLNDTTIMKWYSTYGRVFELFFFVLFCFCCLMALYLNRDGYHTIAIAIQMENCSLFRFERRKKIYIHI